ncbi:uncharacterized protein LOC143592168 [Bidens hawaiensis]|uniref:uncharacterized protein LOC143592168 n=1 Tax=Bidens hawaiensis TaxID=980011 RepID=UPI0040495CA5
MDDVTGGRSGLTLGGILSIKQTPPYRIRVRTLLDLIRDDQISGKESKNTWKMFRDKLRLKLSGSGCANTGTAPTLASHVHLHVTADGNRIRNDLAQLISVSSPANNNNNTSNAIPQVPVEIESPAPVTAPSPSPEVDRVAGGDGEQTPARMSLMSLLEAEGAAYFEGDDVEEEEDDVAVEEGGDGGYKYNNCCVCMVRHKGAAFIPCGHTFCRHCSRELFVKRASCPLCNNLILEILDIF